MHQHGLGSGHVWFIASVARLDYQYGSNPDDVWCLVHLLDTYLHDMV